jgi:transposase InsO family protein/transposase-like protein
VKNQRKNYTAEEKVAILREHLLEKVPISDLCEKHGLHPTMFYRWQKDFFENGAVAFQQKNRPNHQAEPDRIEFLEKKIQRKDEVLAELMAEHIALKKSLGGTLTGVWVPHDTRDQIVDFVRRWSEKTEISAGCFIGWLAVTASKFYDWRERYGKVNEHNGWVPRDFGLEAWEKQAIIDFHLKNPLEGYRRLAFMMLDADVVAVSPSSVWRVLQQAGLLSRWKGKPSKKGTGFEQPPAAHQHWHIDVSYINISGTFYYLCSVLDGYSRFLVHWDLRESMKEADIEIILQRARERHPDAQPRIISDNAPQFLARDFKEFIRIAGMTHVRTSPYYPQSNGKIERWHKSLKRECIRPGTPLSADDARRLIQDYVDHYNTVRLHSAIGYVTPQDMLAGRQAEIHAVRDRKLEQARRQRQLRRQQAA